MMRMKMFKSVLMGVLVMLMFANCSRIDAGHEGMKVNLYGTDRGVADVNLVTGWVYYNPFTTKVYEYPTYVQTVDYEAFSVNAKDGSEFMVDPTISLKVIDGESPAIFKKYRRGLSEIIERTLFNYVKDAFRIELNSFTTDEIVSNRAAFEKNLEVSLRKTLEREGFQLEQLTSGLKYPETIVTAVNNKNEAIQKAMRAENELKVAQAEAAKIIATAEGERQANILRMQALTPLLLQQELINKWDGKLPVYGAVPQLFKGLTN